MVFIKKVLNADAGDADHVGGNDWDVLDDYFDGVATGKTAIINSITRFLGGNLRVRNPANTASYIHTGGAIVAARTLTYPVLTADANFVFDSFPNIFTEPQIIKKNETELFTLYKDTNPATTAWDLNFDANSSGGVQQNYAAVRGEILTNGLGTQDGIVKIRTRLAGSEVNSLTIQGSKTTVNTPIQNESYIDMKAISDPSAPSSGYIRLFLATDGHLKYKRSNGDLVVVD